MKIHTILIFLTVGSLSQTLRADSRDDLIRKNLRDFDTSTAAFMDRIPDKSVENGAIALPPTVGSGTSKYELINAQMDRLSTRSDISPRFSLKAAIPVPIAQGDRAEDLVDELRYRTIDSMESAKLMQSNLDQHPWSGTYWPIAKGIIAWRYADPSFPNSSDWKENSDYLAGPGSSCAVELLSPAEKYDLLVGDSAQTLTHAMLKEGEGYYTTYGSVESWMGICHGWAPASFMTSRPTQGIDVLAADGRTKIRFYPSDMKALTSLLWANGQFENRFIGLRCNDKNPPVDENGRTTDPACYGENPGTWHVAVVNQIGVSRRSFVMDALHDTEIWNQPIYGYRYTYFNPQTKEPATTRQDATISLRQFVSDKFKRYRSRNARTVVGIAMDLTYTAENAPSTFPDDSPKNDVMITVHYLYDLELDASGTIVGGEWYSNAHPGFLWTPSQDAHALSVGDVQLENAGIDDRWDGTEPLPGAWTKAVKASARRGQPLGRIVNALSALAGLSQ